MRAVRLVPYADLPENLELTRSLESNPAVMRELGGPVAETEIEAIHKRRAASVEAGDWWLKIVVCDEAGLETTLGTIGIWLREWKGSADHEIGWMLLPAFQGRGLASQALGLILEQARASGSFERIHAFPATGNEASNALCRKHGFELRGEHDVEYAGRPLRCNDWYLAL